MRNKFANNNILIVCAVLLNASRFLQQYYRNNVAFAKVLCLKMNASLPLRNGRILMSQNRWEKFIKPNIHGRCFCTWRNVIYSYTVKTCPFQYTFWTTSPLTMLRKLCQRMFNIFKRNKFQMKYIPLNLVTTLDGNNFWETVEQEIWLVLQAWQLHAEPYELQSFF